MIINFLLLIFGFVILIKGADLFVLSTSSIGVKLKLPQIIIGLSIVSIGTSLPELFININASLQKNNEIVLGNIIGSNILNILIILGLSACLYPILANRNTKLKEIPFMLGITILLFLLSNDSIFGFKYSYLTRIDGVILLLFIVCFIYYLFKSSKEDSEVIEIKELSNIKIIVFIILGMIGLACGGDLIVENSIKIAREFNVSDKIIGLTIISIGTSLPELVTSLVAAHKKNSSIALGNIIGSNIFNILLVLGLSSIIYPIKVDFNKFIFDFSFLIISAMMLLGTMFILKKSTITRFEGTIMISVYIGYIFYNLCFI